MLALQLHMHTTAALGADAMEELCTRILYIYCASMLCMAVCPQVHAAGEPTLFF